MDQQTYMDLAVVVANLKMYPYFDIAHYILTCITVREDVGLLEPERPGSSHYLLSRSYPFSSWLSSILLSFSGSLIANFLLGEPAITPFKDHQNITTATIVWYLVNYSPFDFVYKVCKFLPVNLAICIMKETRRAHKVYHGVLVATKLFPNAYFIIVIVGTVKGAGSTLMTNIDRHLRGNSIPGGKKITQASFTTKASLAASIIFLCERLKLITVPHPLIYFGVVLFFVYFKISKMVFDFRDPFTPLENLFCLIFLGGLQQTVSRESVQQTVSTEAVQQNLYVDTGIFRILLKHWILTALILFLSACVIVHASQPMKEQMKR